MVDALWGERRDKEEAIFASGWVESGDRRRKNEN